MHQFLERIKGTRRVVLSIALVFTLVGGASVLDSSPASAATNKCGAGYKVWLKKDASYGSLVVRKKGEKYCAVMYHSGSTKGKKLQTAVYIKVNGGTSDKDSGKFTSYAGPARAKEGRYADSVYAYGTIKGHKKLETFSFIDN